MEKITRQRDFEHIYKKGKILHGDSMSIFFSAGEGLSRLAVVAGKKIGGSAERNRAKRRIREAIRPCLSRIREGLELIIVAKFPSLTVNFESLKKEFALLARKGNFITK